MTEILNQLFPDDIAVNIAEYIPPPIDWTTVYGSTVIYKTIHFITFGGGPEGGFVYFYREREAGWYSWERDWFRPPVYTKINGQIVIYWDDDGVDNIGIVPHDYEPGEDETIMDETIMQNE